MRLFRTHRESARLANRTIGQFFAIMTILALLFAAILFGRYVLGWW